MLLLTSGSTRVRVLVAMSGGVDSSVAASLLVERGHQVVGATMKLWGGSSDTGCCSVADVEDARRVAQQLGIDHHVFNFSSEFDRWVVAPYVEDHAGGRTPNPCVECNRHLKFDRFLRRARVLGFDAIATGHHARVVHAAGGARLLRGADPAKDQSYVLHMLSADQLERVLLPVGEMTKADVRATAARMGLRTAAKPDSQDVCFISRTGGRGEFLAGRIPLRPGTVLDQEGRALGSVGAVQLMTVGQRRGLGIPAPRSPKGLTGGASPAGRRGPNPDDGRAEPNPDDGRAGASLDDRRYVLDVDVESATVTVGPLESLMVSEVALRRVSWVAAGLDDCSPVELQCSAHGRSVPGRWRWSAPGAGEGTPGAREGKVELDEPIRRVAPGQSGVIYAGDEVVGGGTVV